MKIDARLIAAGAVVIALVALGIVLFRDDDAPAEVTINGCDETTTTT